MARRKKSPPPTTEESSQQLTREQLEKELFRLERLSASQRIDLTLEKTLRRKAEEERVGALRARDLLLHTVPAEELRPIREVPSERSSPSVPLLCLTDWHFEEIVRAITVNGLNEYNPEIATRRAEQVFRNTVQLLRETMGLEKCPIFLLWLGGDFINGYIHKSFRANNAMPPAKAVIEVEKLLIRGIDYLRAELGIKQLVIATSCGNHARPGEEKEDDAIENSYEFILYNHIATHYAKDAGVSMEIGLSYHTYLSLFDEEIVLRLHHGDWLEYKGGVGGIAVPVRKAIAQWNQYIWAHYDVFGHFHQFKRDRDFVSCGCLVGHNRYAIRIKASPEAPSQALLIFNKERKLWFSIDVQPDYEATKHQALYQRVHR